MYLCHSTVRKNGKTHVYWCLVRSVRVGSRVRQETVATLVELDAQGRASARAPARQMCGMATTQTDLFTEVESAAQAAPVLVNRVRVERGRRFGDVWLGWKLWQALRLDELFAELLPAGREEIRWAAMSAVLVLARLWDPSSELHTAEDWYCSTALDNLLSVPAEKINDDRLCRALDHLLPHKEAIERHIRQRVGELFQLE